MKFHRGILVENKFETYLDQKRVKDLNPNLRTFIFDIFGHVDVKEKVSCKRIEGPSRSKGRSSRPTFSTASSRANWIATILLAFPQG